MPRQSQSQSCKSLEHPRPCCHPMMIMQAFPQPHPPPVRFLAADAVGPLTSAGEEGAAAADEAVAEAGVGVGAGPGAGDGPPKKRGRKRGPEGGEQKGLPRPAKGEEGEASAAWPGLCVDHLRCLGPLSILLSCLSRPTRHQHHGSTGWSRLKPHASWIPGTSLWRQWW
jgi:hypothetical protein